jgi:peroxiredoxin
MRPDIVPGAIFPDYELSDHTAKRRKLSELQEQHPMVLVLSRGGFCPKDRRQAEGLVGVFPFTAECRSLCTRRGSEGTSSNNERALSALLGSNRARQGKSPVANASVPGPS